MDDSFFCLFVSMYASLDKIFYPQLNGDDCGGGVKSQKRLLRSHGLLLLFPALFPPR